MTQMTKKKKTDSQAADRASLSQDVFAPGSTSHRNAPVSPFGPGAQATATWINHPDFVSTLMDTVPALIVVLDTEGRIRYFNKACQDVTGYSFEEVENHTLWEFLLESDSVDDCRRTFSELCAGADLNSNERCWRTKSGEARWIAWSNAALYDDDRRISHIIKTGLDITERKHRERELIETSGRITWLADNISGIYFIASPDFSKVHFVNRAFETIWGRPIEILRDDPMAWRENVHPEDLELVDAALGKQRRREVASVEFRIIRPDGGMRWIFAQIIPMQGVDGDQLVAGYSEDITERRMKEQSRIRQAIEHRDTLIREVHHRIKNNLQGVIGLLRQEADDSPNVRAALEGAICRVRAVAVVYGLEGRIAGREIRLCEMLPAIVQSVEGLTPARLVLDVNLADFQYVFVTASEAVPVALVINELLMNAAKHCDPTLGPCEVRLTAAPGLATVRITNPGRLPADFDFDAGHGIRTGLSLIKALVSKDGARLTLFTHGDCVTAEFSLFPPAVIIQRKSEPYADTTLRNF
jgi:hypothetical protein